jgi:hypothetical protein
MPPEFAVAVYSTQALPMVGVEGVTVSQRESLMGVHEHPIRVVKGVTRKESWPPPGGKAALAGLRPY